MERSGIAVKCIRLFCALYHFLDLETIACEGLIAEVCLVFEEESRKST